MKKTLITLFAVGVGAATAANAQDVTFNWTGDGDTGSWDTAANWEGGAFPNNFNTSAVRIEETKSLINGYSLSYPSSRGFKSLFVDVSRFTLTSSNSRTTRIGDGGLIHFGTGFTSTGSSGNAFTSTSVNHRIWVSAIGDLTLRNDGSGVVGFNFANLQNNNTTSRDTTFTFEGAGSWNFTAASYLGRQRGAESSSEFTVDHDVSVVTASDFTGTISYNATRTANLGNLTLNNGTFEINSAMNIAGVTSVNNNALLAGGGIINGNVSINNGGTLRTGLTSSVASMRIAGGDLTLNSGANFALRILADGSADTVIGMANEEGEITIPAGILTLGGTFIIDAADIGMIDGIVLYSGFSSVVGDFESVLLNGTGLTSLGGGQWNGEVDGYQVAFDAMSGTFTSAVPEPTTVALLLGAASTALIAVRRRVRR